MFTERGFALANRIAKAYAASDAVPAQFRLMNLKKVNGNETWVENTSAIGNCIVAIEVARAVGMSIASVMQNADMIEGKLRWSGKFVIAAINASGRFTPLRFNMRPLGRIKATYKEKTGWDQQARRPVFTDRSVEVDDVECIAWALPKGMPMPPGVYNLDQARAAGLPVIESAPVTMKLAVEEGWYGKSGSKWQTGLAPLMFQYRAGTFFGNIHAPDIVMGMGRTAEEERDLSPAFDVANDGTVHPVPMSELRSAHTQGGAVPMAEVVEPTTALADPQTGEITPPPKPATPPASPPQQGPADDYQPSAQELARIKEREHAASNQPAPDTHQAPPARRSRAAAAPSVE